jgi:hypothetical protein
VASIPTTLSKYTDIYAARLRTLIPQTYFNADTDGNLLLFVNVMSEMLAKLRMSVEDLSMRNDYDVTNRVQLKNIASTFGLYVDENVWTVQRAFVGLASRWVDRKGTDIGFRALIASYGRDSTVEELATYFPHFGDTTVDGSLLFGDTTPTIYFGREVVLSDSHKLYDLSNALSIIQIKLENYNPAEVEFNNALLAALEFLKPIHVSFATPPFVTL